MLSMIERIVLNRFLGTSSYNQSVAYGFLTKRIFLASRESVSKKEVEVTASSLTSYRGGVPQYNTPIKATSGFKSVVTILLDPKDCYNVPWLGKELKILAVVLTKLGKRYLKSLPLDVIADLLGFDESQDIQLPVGYVVDNAFDEDTKYDFEVTSIKKTSSGKLKFTVKMDLVTYPSVRDEGLHFDF